MEEQFRYQLLSLPRGVKRVIVLFVDSVILSFSVLAAYYLRLDYVVPFWGGREFVQPIYVSLIGVIISTPIFVIFGLYRGIFRHSDVPALLITVRALLIYGLLFSLLFSIIGVDGVPRSVGIIQPLIFLFMVTLSRWAASASFGGLYKKEIKKNSKIKVVIYGAGSSGRELCSTLRESSRIKILCFIDDDKSLHGRQIMGYPINDLSEIHKVDAKEEISYVILAIPTIDREKKLQILEHLQRYNISLKQMPSISKIAEGEISQNSILEPSIEDILGRVPIDPNPELMKKDVEDLSVLITGGGGTIGSEICRQVLNYSPKKLIILEHNEYSLYLIAAELKQVIKNLGLDTELVVQLGSVLDEKKINFVLRTFSPNTIYHAAAYKHVHIVEDNPFEGIKNNFLGTMVLARVAIKFGVTKFILISTDKAVRPSNIMGASKRLAEMGLQGLALKNTKIRFAIVRFGNVLNSSGSVVPLFRSQILEGGPVTITHPEVTRYFMTISEATQLVMQAGAMTEYLPGDLNGAPLYLLDMGEPVKIYDLAVNMVHLHGKNIFNPKTGKGDIELLTIGLKPGEKLYEELLFDGTADKTSHPKINVVNESFEPLKNFESCIKTLEKITENTDKNALVAFLSKTVVGYHNE
ncbi:polysaccharide biosynthesis protein [Alphaproteobacteria bacterium]|nr:polysaccharide biosynthesis protein [Alphaproteobacteria bacterium]